VDQLITTLANCPPLAMCEGSTGGHQWALTSSCSAAHVLHVIVKPQRIPGRSLLSAFIPVPDCPWKSVSMDFMGPLPMSKSHNYLLDVIDCLTSQVHLVPMTTHVTSKEVTWLFLMEIVRLHGLPEYIMSDRDAKFTSKFWKEIHRLMGMKLLMSTVLHTQKD